MSKRPRACDEDWTYFSALLRDEEIELWMGERRKIADALDKYAPKRRGRPSASPYTLGKPFFIARDVLMREAAKPGIKRDSVVEDVMKRWGVGRRDVFRALSKYTDAATAMMSDPEFLKFLDESESAALPKTCNKS
jgi:hypothetical protein